MRQFAALMDRHVEAFKDRERLDRLRLAVAASAIMNTGMASKKDGSAWAPWDVFPELQPDEPEEDADFIRVRTMFREMAARQNARMENN